MYNVKLQNFKYNEINKKIYNRNLSSNDLEMNYDPRPVNTRYREFPILDPITNIKYENKQIYDSYDTFFPGNRKPHFNGFATNIDKESLLRNQFFTLQRNDQALYVPSSISNMYVNQVNYVTTEENLNKLDVFKNEEFDDFNPNLSKNIGMNVFNNSTRVQLKNLK